MNVLVTGATGFVGTALIDRLVREPRFVVRAATRGQPPDGLPSTLERIGGEMTPDADWGTGLANVSDVVHLAARVHVMHDAAGDPLAAYRHVNVEGTLNLARQAAAAGVRRFVYLSSVKVNGESGVFAEHDPPAPEDAYGISKHEAEVGLRRIAGAAPMQVVIIRPPLVYGPGVRANFRSLMQAISRGIPLPLGAVHNRRSLIAVDNLVDFIVSCIEHPAAGNETFMISDGEDLSTTDLIRRLARAMGRPARLVPVPAPVLMTVATILGRRQIAERLVGSLQVDITKARQRMAWTPPLSVDEGLRRAAASF